MSVYQSMNQSPLAVSDLRSSKLLPKLNLNGNRTFQKVEKKMASDIAIASGHLLNTELKQKQSNLHFINASLRNKPGIDTAGQTTFANKFEELEQLEEALR